MPSVISLPQTVNLLLKASEWPGVTGVNTPREVYVGSVVSFFYRGQRGRPIHDTYPFVIVSNIFSDAIRGLNLNYLASPDVTKIILEYLDNANFSYRAIEQNAYYVDAYRTYKRSGIAQLRIYDSRFLRALAYVAPRLDPNEITQIEQQIAMMKEAAMRQPEAGETM